MLPFWRNPEFVRHVRAELRPARALTAAVLVLVICALVALPCWASEEKNLQGFFQLYFGWLVGIQYVLLTVWCASTCGQAISRERELKTYDFLKTTRLSSTELMVGKILGVPVVGYFVLGCSLPISVVAGVLGGFSVGVLFWTYVLLVALAIFVSLAGLWTSMQVEKSSAGAVGLLLLLPLGFTFGLTFTPFPGFGAISVFPALFWLFDIKQSDMTRVAPTLFGLRVSFVFLTLLLYVLFGGWLVLMLARNLKRDREEIRLLSRGQAIGFAAFLNLLLYGFLDPSRVASKGGYETISPVDVSVVAVVLNAIILFLVGIAMLTPPEKLKVWWRRHAAREEPYFSEYGLPWPWLVVAAVIAYALLAAEAAGLGRASSLREWQLGTAGLQLFVFLVFTARDILFLQWCNLTRMKRPVVKGVLYLLLYYTAVGIVAAVVSGRIAASRWIMGVLTPWNVFAPGEVAPRAAPQIYVGLALQIAVIFFLLNAISTRLRRPALVPAASLA